MARILAAVVAPASAARAQAPEPARAGRQRGGRAACRKAGARFVMPRTGSQNAALAMAATGSRPRPWLAYSPPGKR